MSHRTSCTSEIMNQFRHFLGWVIGPSQGLCLYRTAQHEKMRTSIHALSGIQTCNLSIQVAKTYVVDHEATEIGLHSHHLWKILLYGNIAESVCGNTCSVASASQMTASSTEIRVGNFGGRRCGFHIG
jgi:sulfite reductase beta subunit-like hemoprotein